MAIKPITSELFDLQLALSAGTSTNVYVISGGPKLHKIGVARNVDARLRVLQSASTANLKATHAEPVHAQDGFVVENRAHRLLASRRVRGEWFEVESETAKLAVEAALRTLMRGEPMRDEPQVVNRRNTQDGLIVLWRRGAISEGQCRAALRYRTAFDRMMKHTQYGARVEAANLRCGAVGRELEDDGAECRVWEAEIGLSQGASGVVMLREVVGMGASLRANVPCVQRRSGRSPQRIREVLDLLQGAQARHGLAEADKMAA